MGRTFRKFAIGGGTQERSTNERVCLGHALTPRYDAVLFDLDGVLTKTANVQAASQKSCSSDPSPYPVLTLSMAQTIAAGVAEHAIMGVRSKCALSRHNWRFRR